MSEQFNGKEYQTILQCSKYDPDEVQDLFTRIISLCDVSDDIKYTNSYIDSTEMLFINVFVPEELQGMLYLYVPDFEWYVVPDSHRVLNRSLTRFYKQKEFI